MKLPIEERLYGGLERNDRRALAASRDACDICGTPFGPELRGRVIDHDHRTGKIRGVVCRSCNTVLGYIECRRRPASDPFIAYLETAGSAIPVGVKRRGWRGQQWRAPEGVEVDRLVLRAPRELIDALAEEADSRGVSMNLLVIEWLEDKLRAAGRLPAKEEESK